MSDYHKFTLDRTKIGLLIRKAIIDSNLTIEQVSIILELTSSRVIYDWMNGIKLPNIENLINLALMLNKKIEDFIALQ